MTTNYNKGYALENKLVNHLKNKLDWPYAIRTAGSHSPCDVLGITPYGVPVMFQCKSTIKDNFDLTKLFNDASVFKLKQMPEGVRKIILIKIGYKQTATYYMYEWVDYRKEWLAYNEYNFKQKRKII